MLSLQPFCLSNRVTTVIAISAIIVGLCPVSALAGEPLIDRYHEPLPKGTKARLGMLIRREPGDPQAVRRVPAVSPDSKLAACAIVKQIVVWDIATGRVVRNITATPKPVGALVFADNSTLLALDDTTGDRGPRANNTVKAWDVRTGKVLRSFEIAEADRSLFSHDSKLLVTTWGDKLDVWNTQTGKKLFSETERHSGYFFTTDDRFLVKCRTQKIEEHFVSTITFRESRTGKVTRTLEWKDANMVIAVSPDGKRLLAHTPIRDERTKDFIAQKLQLLDAETGKLVHSLAESSIHWPNGYVFSPDGRHVAGLDYKAGEFCTWDVETGKKVRTFQAKGIFTYPAYSPDCKMLVHVSPAGRVFVDDLATGVMRDLNPTQESIIVALAFSADGKRLASTSYEAYGGSQIMLWDVANGVAISRFKTAVVRKARGTYNDPTLKLAFAPDDKHLLTQQWDQSVRMYAPALGREILAFRNAGHIWGFTDNGKNLHWTPTELEPQEPFYPRQQRMPDDIDQWLGAARWMASALAYPELQQFRCRPYTPMKLADKGLLATNPRLRIDGDTTPFSLSPDGSVLAESLWRATGNSMRPWERHGYRFCDADVGKEIVRVPSRSLDVLVWFAPDSRSFVSLVDTERDEGRDYSLVLYETRTGQARLRISNSTYSLHTSSHAFSRDGRWLAFRHGKKIEIFDLTRGVSAAAIPHDDVTLQLGFSPDATLLASSSNNNTILLWDMNALVKREFNEPPWTAADKDRLWNDLADADAAKAFAAMMQLKRNPPAAVALMRDRLRWRAPDVDLGKVIEQLAREDFGTRQKATDTIEQIGERAHSALVEALPRTKSLEGRRRLETLLAKVERPFRTPSRLRLLRSIEVLDGLRTPDAAAFLRDIAVDAAGDEPLTLEVMRALERTSVRK